MKHSALKFVTTGLVALTVGAVAGYHASAPKPVVAHVVRIAPTPSPTPSATPTPSPSPSTRYESPVTKTK